MLLASPSERRSAALGILVCLLAWDTAAPADEPPAPKSSTKSASEASDSSKGTTDAAVDQGADLYRRGDLSAAIASWRSAEERAAAAGSRSEQTALLLRIADAEQALGRYRDAVATLERARSAAGDSADPAQRAAIHGSLGNALIALGPPAAARQELERALEIAREEGAGTLAASILSNLGNLDASEKRYPEALRRYDESASIAQDSSSPEVAARALANAASVALRAGEAPDRVRRRLDSAREISRELSSSHDTAYLLVHLGRSYERLPGSSTASGNVPDDHKNAHEAFLDAERIAKEIGDRLASSYALGYQGALYEEHGRLDEALDLTRRARFLAQEAGAPEALYRWDWQLGRILEAKGDSGAAIASYRRAVDSLQEIRFEMAHGYATGGSSFREAVGPVFLELVDLLLAHAPNPADVAAHQARLLEARETVERLKAAELRDYFRDECVDAVQSKIESLDQVSNSTLVIYPILLAERLEILLSRSSGIRRVTVPVAMETLDAETRALRRLLEKRTTLEFLPHAQRVYDWLVRPWEAELADASLETLVFVPDGALRMIPMAALHDGKRYLVERFALAATPGLSLTDPHPLDRENLKIFLSGLSEPVQGFPPLDHVPRELSSIQSLYGGTLLLDRDFRLARVEGTLSDEDFNVVHIASHGEFSSDPGSSYLLTYDGRLTMDRLSDYVGRFRFRDTPIELLTLSACETAEGDERAALGLAGVAIQAGARSALGTLWSVNDAATEKLIVEFYRQLKADSTSKAQALRRAQLALRESEAYEHPFYWSPFLLLSNWL